MQPNPQSIRDLREYPILYVDDEPENLRIFELSFGREFEIFTAENGEAGLEILATKPVAMVLSDHRMPGMTGTDFLARVAEFDPKTIRVMVTAYGDVETLTDAINDGSIYRYIPKPWQPEEVRVTLLRGIEAYALDRERQLLLNELVVMNRVSRSLNQELASGRVLELLAQTMREELRYDGAAIFLLDAEARSLRWVPTGRGAQRTDPALANLSLDEDNAADFLQALEDGISQWLRMECVKDYEPGLREWVSEVAADEILVTPIHGKSGLIAALAVDNRSGGDRFAADDCTMIEGLCNQAAIAIQNASLMEELRGSKSRVQQAERMGTLGAIAARVAQEIDDPLASLRTFIELAPGKRNSDDATFWGESHKIALNEVKRIEDVAGTLRHLGNTGANEAPPLPFHPDEVVSEVFTLLQRDAQLGGVDLKLEAEDNSPKVVGVREQLYQVVLNLVQNALAVTPSGGVISVNIRATASGKACEIEIRDTGPGIPSEQLEKIFDPFYANDSSSVPGLGLMICNQIISDHGGSIEVSSEEGQGATFVVRLPAEPIDR